MGPSSWAQNGCNRETHRLEPFACGVGLCPTPPYTRVLERLYEAAQALSDHAEPDDAGEPSPCEGVAARVLADTV